MAEIKATTNSMIRWKFKCLNCNYRFTALTPRQSYGDYTQCAMCGSKEFEKTLQNAKKYNP